MASGTAKGSTLTTTGSGSGLGSGSGSTLTTTGSGTAESNRRRPSTSTTLSKFLANSLKTPLPRFSTTTTSGPKALTSEMDFTGNPVGTSTDTLLDLRPHARIS